MIDIHIFVIQKFRNSQYVKFDLEAKSNYRFHKMILKKTTVLLIALISSIAVAQESTSTTKNNFNFIGVGYTMGQTMPPLSIIQKQKCNKV